jgi:hypothetical protein
MMRDTTFFAVLTLLLLSGNVAQAQTVLPQAEKTIFQTLCAYDSLEVHIETDLKQLKDRRHEGKQPAVFKVMRGKQVLTQQTIQVEARGAMRRKTCDFPPVKFYFYDHKPASDSAEDVNELKMVSSCLYTAESEPLVAKELLCYELYNLLTDQSFRTKAAKVVFTDPEHKLQQHRSFAFFVEPERELADRLHGNPIKPKIVSPKGMEPAAYDRAAVFQFMIGNSDWTVYTRHNMKTIGLPALHTVVPVPYDFDYAGLVDAPYAVPGKGIDLPNVKVRYFLGMCREPDGYKPTFNLFLTKKHDILQHCQQFQYLSPNDKELVRGYLKAFFAILEDPKACQKAIIDHCGYDKKVISQE